MSTCAPRLGEELHPESFIRPQRVIDKVFIHCSAASRTSIDAKEINRWHMDRGWDCIGYHFFIKTDGVIQYGRNLERTPAAQGGHNSGAIAICLNGLDVKDFTDAQFAALTALCHEIDGQYTPPVTFHGHNEVAAKACPVFDYKRVLGLDDLGYIT